MRSIITVVMFLGLSALAHAAGIDDSGNEFLSQCVVIEKADATMSNSSTIEILQGNLCMMYIRGVGDGMEMQKSYLEYTTGAKFQSAYCVPDGVNSQQLVRVVLKYIRNNPDVAHAPTAELIMKSWAVAFPCSAPEQKKK